MDAGKHFPNPLEEGKAFSHLCDFHIHLQRIFASSPFERIGILRWLSEGPGVKEKKEDTSYS